jgi:hypothetical protein
MTEKKNTGEWIAPYEGNDMLGFVLEPVFKLSYGQTIKSMTNIRDFAIVVTDENIYKIRPDYPGGWCIELLAVIL